MIHQLKYFKYKNKYLNLKNKSFLNKIQLGGNDKILQQIYTKFKSLEENVKVLGRIFEEKKVSDCHGIEHAKKVMCHAFLALEEYGNSITDINIKCVLLAALLHDADDTKFFPNNKNYDNLRLVIINEDNTIIDNVIYMVSIVSSSKNGDNIPDFVKGKEWMLIPRYADRIEAIGIIGIERCFTYNKNVAKLPLYVDDTPRPITEKEIWKHATIERYNLYSSKDSSKNSSKNKSMIDHYYDKLLRLSIFPINNKYFKKECDERRKILIDFLIMFGKASLRYQKCKKCKEGEEEEKCENCKDIITNEDVQKFIEENNAKISHEDE